MIDQIEKLITRNPFEPFLIRTAEGCEYSVPSADHVDIPPKRFVVVVYDDRDVLNILPLRQISGVSVKVTPEG